MSEVQSVSFPGFPIIELPIDSLDSFDYENAENAKYSVEDLRLILIEEIKWYRNRVEVGGDFKKVIGQ